MKRFWGHAVAATCSLVAIGVVDSACAHNDQSIFIRSVQAPPVVGVGLQCTYTPDATLPILNSGLVDAALTNSYSAFFLVGNQLVPQANPDQIRTESNRVEIQGLIVTIYDSGGSQLASYTRLASGIIDPSSGSNPTYGLVSGEILDAATLSSQTGGIGPGATKRVVSHVKVFGQTLGRTSVESNEFEFPIDICVGCLVSFPPGSSDPVLAATQGKPNCAASLSAAGGSTGMITQPCFLGQDQTVDCRLCQGNTACDPGNRATTPGG